MNLRPNALALSTFSDRMLRVVIYLPFVTVIAFALLGLVSKVFPSRFFSEVSVPSLLVLKNQRAFLISKGFVRGLNIDFIVFEAFIWVTSIAGFLRFLTGVFSPQVLNSYREKLEGYGKRGGSPARLLVFYLFLPLGFIGSVNFEFASHLNLTLLLMEHSPRSFLCLSAFLFCGSVLLLVEGLLLFTWVIFFSE
jgi:hypothetical protein